MTKAIKEEFNQFGKSFINSHQSPSRGNLKVTIS